jgi:plastocyanin
MINSRLIPATDCGSGRGTATQFALAGRNSATWITLLLLAAVHSGAVRAADLAVSVVDRHGQGLGEVVVTAAPQNGVARPAGNAGHAVMDQLNRAFVPGVLAVAVGTSVDFPNNDSVSHQVYSFSPAKRFQLPLYKGKSHAPVLFDKPGLVVLGCNIHDQMVGYIYVTAEPFFGTTQADGTLKLKGLAPGKYTLTFWSPLIADAPAELTQNIAVEEGAPANARLQLTRDLRTRPEPRPRHGAWEY